MKIISQNKEYYDYLNDSYGIDEKIVYDRESKRIDIKPGYLFQIHFCGFIFTGIKDYNNRFYYNADMKNSSFSIDRGDFTRFQLFKEEKSKFIPIWHYNNLGKKVKTLVGKSVEINTDKNIKNDCPVLFIKESIVIHNPLLSSIDFGKTLSPKKAYLLLIDWFSKNKNISSNQTNDQKIIAHGFDLKTSFRK